MAFIFGLLGRGFGGLASARGKGGNASPPPGSAPMMRFNSAANSQLLAVLEDF